MASRKLKVNLVLGLQGKGVDEAIKDVQKLGKNIQGLSGAAIKAAAGFAVFKGGQLFGRFAKDAVESATQLERNVAALGNIFGEQAPAMAEFAQNANRIGLNMNEASGAATFLGSVIKQAGFSIDETSKMTQTLIELSADLAITYNRDVSEALNAIAALFRGEYDPIEKFGVGMKQNEIESLKAARGLDKLTGRAEIFADVMVRYEQLLIRSRDAQGAFADQSESLYVQQQVLAATFENVQAAVGLGLTPAFARLTAGMIPIVEDLTPVLIRLFDTLVPVIEAMAANKERVATILVKVIALFGMFIETLFNATAHVIEHINTYKNLAIAFGAVVVGARLFGMLIVSIQAATTALKFMNITLGMTAVALRRVKIAIAATGFGAIAIGIGAIAAGLMESTSDIESELEGLDTELEEFNLEDFMGQVEATTGELDNFNDTLGETAGAAGTAKNAVKDFYDNLANEAAKQSAKLQLEAMGASEGLIQAVLGSGEEWFKVFQDVTRRGAASVREVQALFAQTPAGYDEAMAAYEEARREFEQFRDAALDARDALVDFTREFEILPTIQRQMGEFERRTVDQLESIEERLEEAFDNGYLFENSYKQLRDYARQEFQVLQEIERQRDELLARRNAAEQLINQVSDSIVAGGRLVDVLRDVQDETEQVDIAQVVKKTVEEAEGLREFEVIVTNAIVKPVEEVVSKSKQLVSGYRDIVDRTRAFVQDMKALRELGLDPELFNELVEAGVDAGGATAQALIEGGQATVNEVNDLFGELNALGEELGEETAQVMYGQGEKFVDGIVEGLTAQAEQLEEQAKALAEAFTNTFEEILIAGIERAIAAAEAALAKMPRFEGQPSVQRGGGGDGGGGSRNVPGSASFEEAKEATRNISVPRVAIRPPVGAAPSSSTRSSAMGPLAARAAASREPVRITNNISVSSASARSSYATLSRVTSFGRTPASNSLWNLR